MKVFLSARSLAQPAPNQPIVIRSPDPRKDLPDDPRFVEEIRYSRRRRIVLGHTGSHGSSAEFTNLPCGVKLFYFARGSSLVRARTPCPALKKEFLLRRPADLLRNTASRHWNSSSRRTDGRIVLQGGLKCT
jgi:hypothetical protein